MAGVEWKWVELRDGDGPDMETKPSAGFHDLPQASVGFQQPSAGVGVGRDLKVELTRTSSQ
jgi:hypothetical protein